MSQNQFGDMAWQVKMANWTALATGSCRLKAVFVFHFAATADTNTAR